MWKSAYVGVYQFLKKRDVIINVHTSSCKVPVIFEILMKLEFSEQIFHNSSNIKLHDNKSNGSRAVSCGQTVGQFDMNKLILAFRNFAKVHKS